MIKKLAILTSGGDSSGMNNAVRSIVKSAKANNIEPFLVFEGYKGLHKGKIEKITNIDIDQYINRGGTFIFSSRYPEFKDPKVRLETKERLISMGIDAVVVIGGDGSYQGAQLLHEIGVKTMGLPGTIDNDITSSEFTIGYDTALNSIVENVERIRDTMKSHNRGAIVEVMGHGCGDLALFSGLATGAEVVVTNEARMDAEEIAQVFKNQIQNGKRSVIAIVSEKIFPDLKELEKKVSQLSGVETRVIVLGHTQRGGTPTAQERVNASLMGMKAVELLKDGHSGLAIGILNGKISATPILDALAIPRENREKLAKEINSLNQA